MTQTLNCQPYVEPHINQRLSGYNERFTFTGKELDEETGYGYFGARYMDHELMAGWLSVDPMAYKYPNISPYAYCAWNPVKLVDPDGEEIWICDGNERFKYTAGMTSVELNGFSKNTVNALNEIYEKGSEEGAELINSLCSSSNVFNIKQQDEAKPNEFIACNKINACARNNESFLDNYQLFIDHGFSLGTGGDIMWKPDGYDIVTEKGLQNNPVYQLLHELCHSYDANLGIMDEAKFNGLPLKEWSACIKANCIGSYMGYPKQTIYGGRRDEFGNHIKGTGVSLFDSNGNPINPF